MPWAAISKENQECLRQKVRPRSFKEWDLVLRKMLPNAKDQRGKWDLNYEGPYMVKHTFSRGALILANSEGQKLKHPVNVDVLNQGRIRKVDPRVSRMEELTPSNARGSNSVKAAKFALMTQTTTRKDQGLWSRHCLPKENPLHAYKPGMRDVSCMHEAMAFVLRKPKSHMHTKQEWETPRHNIHPRIT
ncbi:hypothetical protein CR513_50081, partial [Mucuna pruriens]